MKYHFIKPEKYTTNHGKLYYSNHPIYRYCTLYEDEDGLGLAVIQEHFNSKEKVIFWGAIDPCLVDVIYENPKFDEYFYKNAKKCQDGIFPTVRVRKLMWALRMKPLPKEWWEQKLHLL